MPVFILLDGSITWAKGKLPKELRVPYNNKVDQHGTLRQIKLQLMYIPKKLKEAFKKKDILDPPDVGIDSDNAFLSPEKFRQNMVKYQGLNNAAYFNHVMNRYDAL